MLVDYCLEIVHFDRRMPLNLDLGPLHIQRVVDAAGYGVPTICFPDGQCLLGPVLIDPPTGEAAVRPWHAVAAWTEFPQRYELQRPRTAADQQPITETFRPYLEARDWVSINRGKVITFDERKTKP